MAKNIREIHHTKILISNHTVIKVLVLITLFGLGIQFVRATSGVWVLLLISLFLALALNPPVTFLARRLPKRSRGLATALAYLVVLSLIGLLAYSVIPPMVEQTRELVDDLPGYIQQIQTSDNSVARWLQNNGIADELEVSRSQVLDGLASAGTPILSVVKRIFSSVAATLTILVVTFLMLVEGPRWLDKLWSIQPADKLAERKKLAQRMYKVISSYVNGQLIIAFLLGTFSFTLLSIVGLPYALPLASIVGILGLIPLVGNPIGATLLVIVGLIDSLATGLILLIAFTVYQQFENYVLQPKIQSKKVEVSPLTIIVAVLFGVSIAGLLGALTAIPVAASLRIIANDYIERRNLENKAKA